MTSHSWRHGWVPLTMSAALAKAHGNHTQAARLLGQASDARHAKRVERAQAFVTPHPAHQVEHQAAARYVVTHDAEGKVRVVHADPAVRAQADAREAELQALAARRARVEHQAEHGDTQMARDIARERLAELDREKGRELRAQDRQAAARRRAGAAPLGTGRGEPTAVQKRRAKKDEAPLGYVVERRLSPHGKVEWSEKADNAIAANQLKRRMAKSAGGFAVVTVRKAHRKD